MKHKFNKIYIEKLMEISNQENRKKETIIGNLIQMSTFLVMEKKEYWMELQKLFNQRDMEATSQRLLLLRKLLKISKEFHQIFLDNQRI